MKKSILLISFILLGVFSSNANTFNTEASLNIKGLALTQDQPGIFGEDSVECVKNLSIYIEYYRQRNYALAVEPWRWVYHNCPAARQNTYIHGARLLKYLYSLEEDPVKREAYVDTLMRLYDNRIEYFGREGTVLGRKAADLYNLRPNSVVEIHEVSERSIELEKYNSSADVLLINFHSLISLVEAGLEEEEKIIFAYDRAMNIIDHNLINDPDKSGSYEGIKTNLEVLFQPFASCDNIITIFQPRFEENPNDPELLQKLIEMLETSNCTEEDIYYQANLNLHRMSPYAESAFQLGRMNNADGNHQKALEFFEEALTLFEEEEDKYSTYMLMADILYRHFNKYSEARNNALKAADAKPNDGRPFIFIGEMYAATARQCGDNVLTERVAFWAAVDKFAQARSIDDEPSVQQKAEALIEAWSRHFPHSEDVFFHGLEEGQTYLVECWINERTKVRAR